MTEKLPRKLVSILTSAMLLSCTFAGAQGKNSSDSPIEAARYVQRAEEELNCLAAEAGRWAEVAAKTLAQYRTVSTSDRSTVAMLRVRIAFLRNDIEVRQKALKQAADEIEKLMAAKRLSSAQRVIQHVKTETPTCEARFRNWEFEIRQGLNQADRLVQSGDEQVARYPKEALRLYQSAIAINIEQPKIAGRIASARAASRNGHPVLKKVVWITIATALAGAAAYEGQRYYDQRQRRLAASSTEAKPAVPVVSPK